MNKSKSLEIVSLIIVITFCIVAPTVGYIKIGLPPVIIVGGSAIIGFPFGILHILKLQQTQK
jgi:hypothetical protein